MGIGSLSHDAVQVPLDVFSAAGVRPRGELWAAMLDTKSSWDDLIRRHAPDEEVREKVPANPLYQNITGRFVNSHDYIAMEKLHELHASGRYDLVIIDTPPSRNALDFLDAPARMADFFGSRLLRWLTVPYRSRFFTAASKPFYQVADRVLGSRFLQDIAEFFLLFQSMEAGFVARAREVESLLTDPRTSFCVVTTLETSPLVETRFFATALRDRSLHLGAVIVNKVLPSGLREPKAATAANRLRREAGARAAELEPVIARDRAAIEGVLTEVANRFEDVAVVAKREAERLAELTGLAPTMAIVPALDTDIHDLEGLLTLGSYLWRHS